MSLAARVDCRRMLSTTASPSLTSNRFVVLRHLRQRPLRWQNSSACAIPLVYARRGLSLAPGSPEGPCPVTCQQCRLVVKSSILLLFPSRGVLRGEAQWRAN